MHMMFQMTVKVFQNYPTFSKKVEFDLYAVAAAHAVVASWFAYDCFVNSCEKPGENPLSSEKCLMTYGDYERKVMLNTCGYLIFDFICYRYIVKGKGAIAT